MIKPFGSPTTAQRGPGWTGWPPPRASTKERIHQYFGNKEQLFAAVLTWALKQLAEAGDGAGNARDTLVRRLPRSSHDVTPPPAREPHAEADLARMS
ncbi:hypothetical protein ACWEJ6_12420 [Nonomuraea sp. NPDC004702]